MLRNVFVICIVLLFERGFSQTNTLLNETFADNSKNWYLEKDEKKESTITNGHLRIKNLQDDGSFIAKELTLNPQKDFYVETHIQKIAGESPMYGVYFADTRLTKNTKWYYFLINAANQLIFCENSSEKYDYTYYDNTSPTVNPKSTGNKFAIEKKGTATHFYFNDEKVFTLNNVSFWGGFLGYVMFNQGTIEVDDLKVKQEFKINLTSSTTSYTKKNLGISINTGAEEIMPAISADGNTLYTSVRYEPKNTSFADISDIWYSTRKADGTWTPRKNPGAPLNTGMHDFVISIAPDNNTLFVNGVYYKDNGEWKKSEGLSVSHRTKQGWSTPEKIEIQNYSNVAEEVSYAFSPDRKVLISSIESDISYGSTDFYVSFLQSDGSWSTPENMGSILNTWGKEITPFIAADGKTLYFSTNGKPGYGGHDIFFSKRLDDTWKNWSEPVNIGPAVNTANWDAYYSIPASGDIAYIVSDDKSNGKSDIYSIQITEEAKPDPVVIVSGKVLNKSTNAPLEASITYHSLEDGKEIGIARTNPADGSYKIVLPYGKAYGFLAQRNQFLSESNNLDLSEVKAFQEIQRDLYLAPIEIGKTISMNNVFFIQSKPDLLPTSYPEIERLISILQANPEIKIELAGHTDTIGNPKQNLELSEKRVDTIKNYLVGKGIPSSRITGKGYGGTKPLIKENTEEAHRLNRRVEFMLVK